MALSNFLIRPPAEAPQAQSAVRNAAQRRAAPAKDATAFAALMDGQTAPRPDGSVAGLGTGQTAGKASGPASGPTSDQTSGQTSGQTPGPASGYTPGQSSGLAPAALGMRNVVLAGRSPSDLMRAQVFGKAQADLRQTQAMDGLMRSVGGGGSTLDLARSMGVARQLRSVASTLDGRPGAGLLAMGGLNMGDFVHTRATGKRAAKAVPVEEAGLGKLSARFESGGDGIAAVGYDRNGGTSYGKYQVSSRAGSMSAFLNFLDTAAPDMARRLRAAGPANTGSRRGAVPDEWRAIAREQPERFEDLQETFIRESHYEPALEAITARTSLQADKLSPAMREVIWSTAVQHGPTGAARIFDRAEDMSGNPKDPGYERKLISNVYQIRSGQFGSSTSEVQAAVSNRFRQEKALALNMLNGGGNATLA